MSKSILLIIGVPLGAYYLFITPGHQYLFRPPTSYESTPILTGGLMPKLSNNGEFNVVMMFKLVFMRISERH